MKKEWFSISYKVILVHMDEVFQTDLQKCQVNTKAVRLMGLTTLTLVEETGSHVILQLRSSFSGTLSPKKEKKKVPEEIYEENHKAAGAAVCRKIYLASLRYYCLFLDTKTKAFILLILKGTFPSTSINLQSLKRAPVSSSKRDGFRNLTGRRGVFKPLTAKPDIS